MLLKASSGLAGLAVYPDDFTLLAICFEALLRSDAEALKAVFDSDDKEEMHEQRGRVQHHWRQMQLLTPCWSSSLVAPALRVRPVAIARRRRRLPC